MTNTIPRALFVLAHLILTKSDMVLTNIIFIPVESKRGIIHQNNITAKWQLSASSCEILKNLYLQLKQPKILENTDFDTGQFKVQILAMSSSNSMTLGK